MLIVLAVIKFWGNLKVNVEVHVLRDCHVLSIYSFILKKIIPPFLI